MSTHKASTCAIARDCLVTIAYRCLGESDREVCVISREHPFRYVHGHGRLFAGVERGLEGCRAGERIRLTLPPAEAAGEWEEALDVKIAKAAFRDEELTKLYPGARFPGDDPTGQGRQLTYTVIRVAEDGVIASANHPLAGETLFFDIDILEVRQADERERALLEEVEQPDPIPGLPKPSPPKPATKFH